MQRYTLTSQRTPLSSADAGTLSNYMSKVYMWMMFGLLMTFGAAYYTLDHAFLMRAILTHQFLFFGIIIAEVVMVIAFARMASRIKPMTAFLFYLAYTLLSGLTFSVILFAYTQQSVLGALLTCTGAFFALSLFGFVTKRDLGPLGTFCMMGVFGIMIMMVLSFFIPSLMGSSVLQKTISVIGLIAFSGLTAYDTQKIKQNHQQGTTHQNSAIFGALILYLDFINMFIFLLRLMGNRR
jgi:FtsH-binding integral membrane protein